MTFAAATSPEGARRDSVDFFWPLLPVRAASDAAPHVRWPAANASSSSSSSRGSPPLGRNHSLRACAKTFLPAFAGALSCAADAATVSGFASRMAGYIAANTEIASARHSTYGESPNLNRRATLASLLLPALAYAGGKEFENSLCMVCSCGAPSTTHSRSITDAHSAGVMTPLGAASASAAHRLKNCEPENAPGSIGAGSAGGGAGGEGGGGIAVSSSATTSWSSNASILDSSIISSSKSFSRGA